MLIKFQKPDPRAGDVVRMDSNRGQFFVDSGAAVRLKENGSEADAPAAALATAGDAANGKPSDGLTVPQIKEALEAKKIAIPEGVTLKADLAALLDGAQ